MTPNSNNGRPPAPRTGAKPVNGNGRAKGNADQGDLWSDAPAKPVASPSPSPAPIIESRSPAHSAAPAPATPVVDQPSGDLGAVDVEPVAGAEPVEVEPLDDEALDDEALEGEDLDLDASADPAGATTILAPPLNGRSTRASQAALPATKPEVDSRPNLLETVPAAPFAEPDVFEDDYADEEYEDEYGEGYYYQQDDMSLLRNPYVLAGLAVAMAIILAVAVVFLFGRGGNDGGGNNGATVQTPTVPAGGNGGAVPGGLGVKSIAQATVREGPSLDYLELGLLRANQDVQVVGRNQDSSWYQIVYPRDSQLRGWVPKSALSVPEAAAAGLVVVTVTPIDRPTVAVPTATSRPAEPSATPDATEAPNQRADIGVVIASDCAPNANISLQITNAGNVPISHNVQVIVSNNGSVEYDRVFEATIAPGQAAALNTGVRAEAPSMSATVILQGLQDVNAANNIASCAVSGGSPGGGNNSGGGNNDGGGTNVPPPISTPRN